MTDEYSHADFDNHIDEGSPMIASNNTIADNFLLAPCQTRSIRILFVSFVVLVILLFVVPRYAVNTGDGLMDIGQALSYILLFGIAILGVSIASLVLTISNWSRLSRGTKILGLSPIIGSVIIVLVVALLVAIASKSDNGPDSPMPCNGNETNDDCPTPKNYTKY